MHIRHFLQKKHRINHVFQAEFMSTHQCRIVGRIAGPDHPYGSGRSIIQCRIDHNDMFVSDHVIQ